MMLLTVMALLALGANAGHNDMFGCRGKGKCDVVELGDSNFETELASPMFAMFYAPWCGHCKQLAPTLKKAAQKLEAFGCKVAAIDVEPNPKTQAKFPDIRGFPTLKFLPNSNPKKAIDYNGARDESSIVEFAKEQAKKSGAAIIEPVEAKSNVQLYSFFGRSALDRKPALLAVGTTPEAPKWVGQLATELRKAPAAEGKEGAEAKTKELLRQAASATKLPTVREGITAVLETLAQAEKSGSLGPAVVFPAYTSDPAAIEALGLAPAQLPAFILASIDRKTGGGHYVLYPAAVEEPKKGKLALEPLVKFVQGALPAANDGPAELAKAPDAKALPPFPKPQSVLAAEEREKKRREKEGGVAAAAGQKSIDEACFSLTAKTCVLLALPGGAAAASADEPLAALAKKYHKDGLAFSAIDSTSAPAAVIEGLFGAALEAAPSGAASLVVVKGGKRPRVAVAGAGKPLGAGELGKFLDTVVGGGASFEKLSGGLPAWPGAPEDAKAEEPKDDSDVTISDDEL